MKKKSPPKGARTIFWWIVWIALTILSFFAAAAVWTPIISRHFGSVRESRNAILWVCAVFGSWVVILVPLIIVMYQKVDKAYDDARSKREKALNRFRTIHVEKSMRILPSPLSAKLGQYPETIDGGHLVDVTLRDGRKIPYVFIVDRHEILGLYDFEEMPFEGCEVRDLEISDLKGAPTFLAPNWLRLDGANSD